MRRYLPLAVALAVLALAAPAQAEITSSAISSPADPHFVLVDLDQPTPTIDVAGTASGSGNIDIVCMRAGAVHVLLHDQPVAANGTFALADVPLTGLPGTQWPYGPGLPCRLAAWPAGMPQYQAARFEGPRLAISSIVRSRWGGNGPNAGVEYEADVYPAGLRFAARAETFGSVGLFNAFMEDPTAPAPSSTACSRPARRSMTPAATISASRSTARRRIRRRAPCRASAAPTSPTTRACPRCETAVTSFSSKTGDLTFVESDPLVKCGPVNVYPPSAGSCIQFEEVPVRLERTTESSAMTRRAFASATGGSAPTARPHRLDLSLRQGRCYGTAGLQHRRRPPAPGRRGLREPGVAW